MAEAPKNPAPETFQDLKEIFLTCPKDKERFVNGTYLYAKDVNRARALLAHIKEDDFHLDRELYLQERNAGKQPNICLYSGITTYEWSAIATAAKNYVVERAKNSGKELNIEELESQMATLDIRPIHDQAMAIYRREGGGQCPTKTR